MEGCLRVTKDDSHGFIGWAPLQVICHHDAHYLLILKKRYGKKTTTVQAKGNAFGWQQLCHLCPRKLINNCRLVRSICW